MLTVFKVIKQKLLSWATNEQTTTIKELLDIHSLEVCDIPDYEGKTKFIAQKEFNDLFVETPSGYSPVKRLLKTIEYAKFELELENGMSLECADEHLVINELGEQIQVKDLKRGDLIKTINGLSPVKNVFVDCVYEHMYDLELDDQDHVYYTNGILSHNTTVIAAYLLWYACFHDDQTVLVASNRNVNAIDIMSRIIYAYEELPMWLKPGAKYARVHSIEFDNGSKINSQATSEKTGRGSSGGLIFLDEVSHVSKNIQEKMWASVYPVVSNGAKIILSTTPNGDDDLFAQLWRGAEFGDNGYSRVFVGWDEHPMRDEKWKKETVKSVGELVFRQEYACEFLSSDPLLINSLTLANLKHTPPTSMDSGFKFWDDFNPNKTYFVSVDIATGDEGDYSTIQVIDFPTMVQIAEYRSNKIEPNQLYSAIRWILTRITLETIAKGKASEIYWSFENNGVGQAISALYFNDEKPFPENAELLSLNEKKLGFVTSGKTKISACLDLKKFIEKGKLNLKSDLVIAELKNFIATRGSYAARAGATDDLVSALLIFCQMIKKASDYNEDAYNMVYDYTEDFNVDDDYLYDDAPPIVF